MSTAKGVRVRPPAIAGLYLLAAAALHVLVPAQDVIRGPVRPLGLVVAGLGVLLTAWALRLFARRGTTHNPYGTPSALVATGPFSVSRNPMYLGLTLVLLGIAVMAGAPLLLLAPLAFFLTMHAVFIPREEQLLERALGSEYLAYKRRVRRWPDATDSRRRSCSHCSGVVPSQGRRQSPRPRMCDAPSTTSTSAEHSAVRS